MKTSELLTEIRACDLCESALPVEPRPVLQLHPAARLLIAGQAPGRRVHESGVPFDDPSGERLRDWLGVDRETFYDEKQIAIVPMGFCYPGTGKSGDLPPRPECAAQWREPVLARLKKLELTVAIGSYAVAYHLRDRDEKLSVTEATRRWKEWGPAFIALPHPSPRNTPWLRKHTWFERDLLPTLRRRVARVLG